MNLKIFTHHHERSYTLAEITADVLNREQRIKPMAIRTLEDYQVMVRHWERLMVHMPVEEITQDAITTFRDLFHQELLAKSQRRSAGTVNKHMRYLRRVISRCFPADSHNPDGMGIIDYFRFPSPLSVDDKVPRIFRRKQVSDLYRNADQMTWPRCCDVEPAQVWRLLLVLGWNLGPRSYDLIDLQWSGVNFDDFRGIGSITYKAQKTGKLQRIPMHPVVKSHLQSMPRIGDSDRIFPTNVCFSNRNRFRIHWRTLLQMSGISQDHHLEDFRKTCNTEFESHFPGVGQFVLGHSLSGVNARHYFNPTKAVIKACLKLPQPKAFRLGAEIEVT